MTPSGLVVIVAAASQLAGVFLLVRGVDAAGDTSCNATCEYTAWAMDANCRDRGLTAIPGSCWQCEMMDLRNNALQSLGPGAFEGYSAMRYLDMEFNRIANVTEGAFVGCTSLLFIYLQFNVLQGVGEEAFRGAVSLERLFLNQNSITEIHPGAFRGLNNLNGLYIGNNDIAKLDATVFQHTPLLKYLHIGTNQLESLPHGIFDHLPRLLYLDLENNQLRFLDGLLLENLDSLEELNLSGNQIQSVIHFPTLPNLNILDLYQNDLQDLGGLSETVAGLDQFYLGGNDNINCTCSANPVREWLIEHRLEAGIDAVKVNATCYQPQSLRGRLLYDIPKASLCPRRKVGLAGSVPKTRNRPVEKNSMYNKDDNKFPAQQVDNSIQDHQTVIYVAVASVTLLVIVLVLAVLVQCMKSRTRKYMYVQEQMDIKRRHQQDEQHQQQQQQRGWEHQQRDVMGNRSLDIEDPLYEPVGGRLYSSTNDSAFGSLDNVVDDEEEDQSWEDRAHLAPPGEAQQPSQPYMSMEVLRALQPSPPVHDTPNEERTPLAREQLSVEGILGDGAKCVCIILNGDQSGLLGTNPRVAYVPLSVMAQNLGTSSQGEPSDAQPLRKPYSASCQSPVHIPQHPPPALRTATSNKSTYN